VAQKVTPRDLTNEKTNLIDDDLIEMWDSETDTNGKIKVSNLSIKKYVGDPILTDDILIPVNGIKDSQNNRSVQKKISWNPYEEWKKTAGLLKFNRGEAGVFGEYENLWQSPSLSNATLTDVGEWEKIENTTAAAGYALVTLSTAQDEVYCSFVAKKGNTDDINIVLRQGGLTHNTSYTFSTGSFGSPGNFDSITSTQINGTDEVIIKMVVTGSASGTDYFRVFASNAATSGLYTYYKEISCIGGIDYPVPYVKGIHTADSWVHPVNWNESTDWTIDMWFKPEKTDTGVLFDTRANGGQEGLIVAWSSGNFQIATIAGGVATSVNSSVTPVVSQYSHCKIVYESGTRTRIYVNGSLGATITINVPVYTDLEPLITFDRYNSIDLLNGYISEIMIRPSADITDTHYTLNKPWTNPENVIEAEYGAYIDKYNNIVGDTITTEGEDAYSVVEQYTIGDQTVTKWSNGDMEIRDYQLISSLAITTAIGSEYKSATNVGVLFPESFTGTISVLKTVMSASHFIYIASGSNADLSAGNWVATSPVSITASTVEYTSVSKGKWK